MIQTGFCPFCHAQQAILLRLRDHDAALDRSGPLRRRVPLAEGRAANFFGGLTIYLDRPFKVGEWIRSPDKAIEGTVEYIGWRRTRVRAPIYVPNALFTTVIVENPTRMTHRRINETIGVRCADLDKMAAIIADVKTMLQTHPEIDSDTTLIVNFNRLAASSLDVFVYAFTRSVDWVHYHEVKQDVLLKIVATDDEAAG